MIAIPHPYVGEVYFKGYVYPKGVVYLAGAPEINTVFVGQA